MVAGLGVSGVAAAGALSRLGADVSVYDAKRGEEIEERLPDFLKDGRLTRYLGTAPEKPGSFDLYVLSPGLSPKLAFIREAERAGVEIAGELEIAYRIGKGGFVAITGTNGKTTTTALVGEMFQRAGRETYVVGNIGVPAVSAAMTAGRDAWMITEVSSFQLETVRRFKPRLSALLNLTPDHLDRHGTMEKYGNAKANVWRNQTEEDFLIVNDDDPLCRELSKGCKAKTVPFSRLRELAFGASVKEGELVVRGASGELVSLCGVSELRIPGAHNLENALAASALAYFAGIPASAVASALRSFAGVAHRLEFCGERNGARWINDSKGTNPDASVRAIEALDGPLILIAGGSDKNTDFAPFVRAFAGKVKRALLMGATAEKIKEAAEREGFTGSVVLNDMEECVREAFRFAAPGDTVLLSPACASFDRYTGFEQRGADFKKQIAGLGG